MNYFLKTNIKQILKFLAIDLSNDEHSSAMLTEGEFNMLKLLLQLEKTEPGMLTYPLSKYTGLYNNVTKVPASAAGEWLTNNTSVGDPGKTLHT